MTDVSQSSATRSSDSIDVHAHFVPDFYADALRGAGHEKPDGMPAIPSWDVDGALKTMDLLGVRTALLSVSSPGVHFGDDARARQLARRVNEEGRRLVLAHPDRFGLFASLPLPDMAGALDEAAYALDELRADGIILETNAHGLYLGDPRLEPLYAELNRRKAVILVHPTSPACDCCARLKGVFPAPAFEFMFETTRSITDMVVAGVLARHPDLRIIVPHAGAALPVLLDRIELMSSLFMPGTSPVPSMRQAMKTLHFDVAGSPVPVLLSALLDVADPAKIHYGSDYPFTPAAGCDLLLRRLEGAERVTPALRRAILRDNALALFPRLREGGAD
ncbi:amidohydrolase family protein [Ancylobacter lacus]|uniref:amidohydrolase family protein n=1 Tax=Ancylobacter lacus TaxID=2579970 RepID=UPI001FEAEAA7|nr:amidohydrolase family protein [Ancylobacter lacus]